MSYIANWGATPWTNNVGYLNIPILEKSANYTTILTDSGKCILHPASDANARTFTIDSNANVAYPVGTVLMFKNNSANNLTIAITSDTLTLDWTGTTWSWTLAQYGKATAMKETSTTWSIGGVGLTVTPPTPPVTYATWNPADKDTYITLSWWDLVATDTISWPWSAVRSTIGKSSGKWYWELTITDFQVQQNVGIAWWTYPLNSQLGIGDSYAYSSSSYKYHEPDYPAYWASWTEWDIIGIALDMTGGTLEFFKNGASQWVAYTWLSWTYYAAFSGTRINDIVTANFWASAFTYSPPAGFNAWLYA